MRTSSVGRLSTATTVGSSARRVLVDQVEVDVVHHSSRLTLHVTTTVVTRRLNGAEATSSLRVLNASHVRVVVRGGLLAVSLLMTRLNDRMVRLVVVVLCLHGATNWLVSGHIVAEVRVVPVATGSCAGRWLEERALSGTCALVLRVVERSVLLRRVRRASRARCDTSDACRVRRIAVFPLDWLDDRVVQVDDEVLVDRVLVRRLAFTRSLHYVVHATRLSPSLVRCESLAVLVLALRHVDLVNTTRLNSLIVHRVVTNLANVLNGRADILAYKLPAILDLVRVKRRRHVQVLLLRLSNDVRIRRVVLSVSRVMRLGDV